MRESFTTNWRHNNPNVNSSVKFLQVVAETRKKKFKEDRNKKDKNYDFDFKQNDDIKTWATGTLDKLIYIVVESAGEDLLKMNTQLKVPCF